MINRITSEINAVLSETTELIERLRDSELYLYPDGEDVNNLRDKLSSCLGLAVDENNILSDCNDLYNCICEKQSSGKAFVFLTKPDRERWILDFWTLEWRGIPLKQIITPDQLEFCISVDKKEIDNPLSKKTILSTDTLSEKIYKNELNDIIENIDQCEEAYNIFNDNMSKSTFLRILANRILRCHFYDKIYCSEQYFISDIFGELNSEVYFDVGAYNGDTVISFSKRCLNYKRIYAFEPDTEAFLDLIKNTSDIRDLTLIHAGLYEDNCTQVFKSGAFGSSHIRGVLDWDDEKDHGIIQPFIQGDSINELPTYIKMDIEGSEIGALNGLKKTIESTHPKLAICAYHRPHDIWEIPLLISQLNPDYKVYLRHHSHDTTETVCYAV